MNPTQFRTAYGVLPIVEVLLPAHSTCIAVTMPQVPFRILQLWTYSPGDELLIESISVGNQLIFASQGSVPAAAWDIVAVTEAVKQAIAAGWRSVKGEMHPFYDRLKIDAPTASPGANVRILLRNPTDDVLRFRASFHGLTLQHGGGYGNVLVGEEVGRHFQEMMSATPPTSSAPSPASATVPAPAPAPAPVFVLDPLASECRTCGALPGARCYGMSATRFHIARSLKKGDCPGCPRAAWAAGMLATCMLCGRTKL